MIKKIGIFLSLLLCVNAASAEDFISEFEYGQMLYQNPRGVSCVPCHGDRGQGAEIARYRDARGREIIVRGPDIRHGTARQIAEALRNGPGVMPRYFLTDKEIQAIVTYIREVQSREPEK